VADATVVIVTRDRRDEVLGAVASAVAQQGDVEVLVLDDGSTDDTASAITSAFPDVRVVRSESAAGYIARRNEAAQLSNAPVLVNLDDDAEFTSPHVVAQTIAAFDHRRIGVVAVPLIDVPRGEDVRQHAPTAAGVWVTQQFMGTAGAIRREAFIRVGGYPELLQHQSEESDLCLRLLAHGYVVRLGRGDPVRHYASPKRNVERVWFLGCRNDIIFGWRNVPMPDLLGYWLKTALYGLRLGLGVGRVGLFARGLLAGFAAIRRGIERRPVEGSVYRLYRRLGRGPLRLDEIEHQLPPLEDTSSASG
jgi:GT2 family glycosyltransferase